MRRRDFILGFRSFYDGYAAPVTFGSIAGWLTGAATVVVSATAVTYAVWYLATFGRLLGSAVP